MTASPGPKEGCVFCAIAEGKAPARMVYRTGDLLCFFPRRPEVLGHTLIVSRFHCQDVRDCPPGFGASVFAAAQRLAERLRERLGAGGFNLMNASGAEAEQSVPHLHFHFLPRFAHDSFSTWPRLPPLEADLDGLIETVRIV